MTVYRRAALLKMASAAYELDLNVLRGQLHRSSDGRWLLGERALDDVLNELVDDDIMLILGSLSDNRVVAPRTCRTCGRDYTDPECPTCRANRIRLRGRA